MCLFTHFAAGALVGGLVGDPVIGALAGIASHAVLDMIPHYDHPDWRLELLGGIGALILLLALPFGSTAAAMGGLGGMLPDLENLFQKLGWYPRRYFIFPTHNGILPHGRRLERGSLRWQLAIFSGCFLVLGLSAPRQAEAAIRLPNPQVILGQAEISVLESGPDRTVVKVHVPLVKTPADWSAVDLQRVQWGDPLELDEENFSLARFQAPHRSFALAVPTLVHPELTVLRSQWWREPSDAEDLSNLAVADAPRVFRSVPLVGCDVNLGAGGGILSDLVLEIQHPRSGEMVEYLVLGDKNSGSNVPGFVEPKGLLNSPLYRVLSAGARDAALARLAAKGGDIPEPSGKFSQTTHWVRLDVDTNGPTRVTGAELSTMGVPVTLVDPTKLRLFRGGGMALSKDPTLPDSEQVERIGLNEVAIQVLDGQDQEWNLDDEFRFYAVASSAWRDNFAGDSERLDFYDHPFAEHATYWLTWENDATVSPLPGDPLRMVEISSAPGDGPEVSSARVRLHLEKQRINQGGLVEDNWLWDSFISSSRPDTFFLQHPVPGSAARFVVDVRGNYGSRTDYPFRAEAWLNGDSSQKAVLDFTVGQQSNADSLRVRVVGLSTAINAGLNTITTANTSQSYGNISKQLLALDSFDISYRSELILDSERPAAEVIFSTAETGMNTSPFNIRLQKPGTSEITVWDVSVANEPRVLLGSDGGSGSYLVGYSLDDAADHRLAFLDDTAFAPVKGGRVEHPVDLRLLPTDYDHLTVYAPEFELAARSLASYRATAISGIASPAAAAVSALDIYNDFSGGQKDPRAIRNYLKWVYEESGHRLRYVCFIGNASRDYRNYMGKPEGQGLYDFLPTEVRTVFPAYPTEGSRASPYASDDGLVSFDYPNFGGLDFPDLACGRIASSTLSDALDIVSRTIAYDANPEPGLWRNRVVFSADDANRPEHGANAIIAEISHTVEADVLTEDILPTSLDVLKIYGVAYSFPGPNSFIKPQMRNDVNAAMSDGTTIFHYVGHGAEDNLADEQIFQSEDIPNLINGMKRLVFIAFSCDVGVFDSPNRLSMAEQFLGAPNGGAIGCICASQVSYVFNNNRLSEAFYQQLYPERRVAPEQTVGAALLQAKGVMPTPSDISNAQRYNFFGDPALSLPNPPDILDFSAASVDTLRTGNKQSVVMSVDGEDPPQPGDTYNLSVEDSGYDQAYIVNFVTSNPNPPPQFIYTPTERFYHKKGSPVFHGSGAYLMGQLEVPFINPVQFRYGDDARIRMVVEGADRERAGAMSLSSVRGGGSVSTDVNGPLIDLSFADNRYRVRAGSLLTANLADSSGIAILGTSPGNSLLLEFDNSGFMTDVTSSFAFDQNSYTSGQLAFPLPADLILGMHRAALHGSDALGNVGSDTLSFQVIPEGVRGIESMTLFPNPTAGPCRLLFDLSDPMTVQWEIYTLAGRTVRVLREEFGSPGPVILEWDGRDERGDEIANGTYLFVLRGLSQAADDRVITKTGKLVVMR